MVDPLLKTQLFEARSRNFQGFLMMFPIVLKVLKGQTLGFQISGPVSKEDF